MMWQFRPIHRAEPKAENCNPGGTDRGIDFHSSCSPFTSSFFLALLDRHDTWHMTHDSLEIHTTLHSRRVVARCVLYPSERANQACVARCILLQDSTAGNNCIKILRQKHWRKQQIHTTSKSTNKMIIVKHLLPLAALCIFHRGWIRVRSPINIIIFITASRAHARICSK